MTDQERDQMLARISALEVLLEIGYANWMSQMSTSEFSEFQRNFDAKLESVWALESECFGSAIEPPTDVIREAQGIAARFWRKVRDVEGLIRTARGRNKKNGETPSLQHSRAPSNLLSVGGR